MKASHGNAEFYFSLLLLPTTDVCSYTACDYFGQQDRERAFSATANVPAQSSPGSRLTICLFSERNGASTMPS